MKHSLFLLALPLLLVAATSCGQPATSDQDKRNHYPIQKSDEEWRALLTPQEYHVLREKGTERAFTGEYNDFKKRGSFICAACATPLFSSETKYDSRSGWPSFYDVISPDHVTELPDRSHGWVRTEVVCGQCGGHLGHVFEDGPQPTGLRYCINSAALDFDPAED